MSKRVLITGAAGFVGAAFVRYYLQHTGWEMVLLDRLTYAGTLERLRGVKDNPRLRFVYHDFRSSLNDAVLRRVGPVDYVIHCGAESHVDRSLSEPQLFVDSNVTGTLNMLEAARALRAAKFLLLSTDEVHGPAPDGVEFDEDAPIKPSNPYAATKAAAEALTYAWARSYRLPTMVLRSMNMYGAAQHPEKFVPLAIGNVLAGREGVYHGTPERLPSRKWIHTDNVADAAKFLLELPVEPLCRTYHVAGEERTNIEVLELISDEIGKLALYRLVDAHSQRPGHDLRYALSDAKLRVLGWSLRYPFEVMMRETVLWYKANPEWLEG